MENNLNYSSEVRKKILSMLMFQLYSDERTIYREYVQNALDSINKAIDTRVLNQAKDGVVNIDIDVKHKVIRIKDNGAGIESANAVRTLLDISPSNKEILIIKGEKLKQNEDVINIKFEIKPNQYNFEQEG